jgi:glucose dehydrogenase
MRVARSLWLATSLLAAARGTALAQGAIPEGDWRTINRDAAATRFSPLDEINRGNVARLTEAWNYPFRSFNTAVPIVVDGTMYFPAGNRVVALDADTGQEKWVFTLPNGANGQPQNASTRGVSFWPGDRTTPARILVMSGSKMLALDASNGQPSAGFGEGGMIDVGIGYGGTPTIAEDVAVIGAATLENQPGDPGNTRAFDVRSGRKLWEFASVAQPGQPGNETWGNGWKGRSGTNMWAFSAPVDLEQGIVIIPLGSPAPNYWGGERPGANLFGNSLVALDYKTGEYKWHFQTVHHDIWDVDQPTAGALIEVNGRPVIASINKTSLFFVLDRETGEPHLPVEERPVPAGDVPGEYYHPTQPFPVSTPPLSRVSLTYDDIVDAEDTTPEHARACREMWDKAGGYLNYGPYTPFMFHVAGTPPRSTIQLPGGTGGVNWGGPAADPTTGLVYVNAQDTSLVGWVERKVSDEPYSFDYNSSDQPYDRASVNGQGPFFSFSAPLSGQYDEQGRAQGPQAGPTVTAGGLVFVGATNDRRFRAFDSATGQQLWETQLSANANANPMTYRGRSGKQYVAINAGGTIRTYSLSR